MRYNLGGFGRSVQISTKERYFCHHFKKFYGDNLQRSVLASAMCADAHQDRSAEIEGRKHNEIPRLFLT